jgi:hypothetical protein
MVIAKPVPLASFSQIGISRQVFSNLRGGKKNQFGRKVRIRVSVGPACLKSIPVTAVRMVVPGASLIVHFS